jgi:hypothetical protein
VSRAESEHLLDQVLALLVSRGAPASIMVSRVVEITADGKFAVYDLPGL